MSSKLAKIARKEAAIKEFNYIVINYILPLLPVQGDLMFIDEPTEENDLKNYLIKRDQEGKEYLYIYPALSNPQFSYKIELLDKEPQLGAADIILKELMMASKYDYRNDKFSCIPYYERFDHVYQNNRFDLAFEIGLCMWLGGKSVFQLLHKLKEWSKKTYEGRHVPFSFIIDTSDEIKGQCNYIRFLDSNHSAVFTDGFSSGIRLDIKGQVVNYFSTASNNPVVMPDKMTLVPYRFQEFANLCVSESEKENLVGIVAQANGDILIFKNRNLCFANRNGYWKQINSYRIYTIISQQYYDKEDMASQVLFGKEVYSSLLDVSFSHAGGCLAIIDPNYVETVKKEYIFKDDLSVEDDPDDENDESKRIIKEKKSIIKKLILSGKDYLLFQNLDRKLRSDLLSLDGATVIDSVGRILGAGAIVKITGGSDGGGRSAATKQLAEYGMAIKISMDGRIEGYRRTDLENPSIEKVFTLF